MVSYKAINNCTPTSGNVLFCDHSFAAGEIVVFFYSALTYRRVSEVLHALSMFEEGANVAICN